MDDQFLRRVVLAEIVLLSCFLGFLSVSAQEEDEKQGVESSRIEIDTYARNIPPKSAGSQPGKVGLTEAEAEVGYEIKVWDKLPVGFSLGHKYIGINEEDVKVDLPSHLTALTADVETTLPFFKVPNTYVRVGVSPSFSGDDWDYSSSSFRIPSRIIGIYQLNKRWTFIGGVGFYPEFETEAVPIAGFIYKPNEKLKFNIVPPRPSVSYMLNDKVTLFTEGGGNLGDEYEVKRNDAKKVVLQYNELYAGGGIKLKLNRIVQMSLSSGMMFNRSLRYRDEQGKVTIDNGAYSELRVQVAI